MKLSGAKLKNIEYKQLLIDHGEKAVLLLIGLFVLVALVRTNWARYDRTPDEMIELASEADAKIQENPWPESDQKQILTYDNLLDKVELVQSKVDVERHSWPIPFNWSPYAKRLPREEPEWLPVEQLQAGYGRVLLAMTPEQSEEQPQQTLAENQQTNEAESQIPAEFRTTGRRGIIGGGRKQGVLNTLRSGRGVGIDEDEEELRREQASQRRRERRGRRGDDEKDFSRGGMMLRSRSSFAESRGFRFISVRGIYPLAEQLREIQRASHVDDFASVENAVEILDFELERQQAVPGDDPWAGPWEAVDIQDAQDVLDAVIGWEADVVDSGITDAVFTMPLPMRGFGIWSWEATHPGVEEFELSAEEIEEQVKFDRELLLRNRQQQKKEEERLTKGGFARQQEDLRQIHLNFRSRSMREQDRELTEIVSKINQGQGLNAEELEKRLKERIQGQKASPLGKLLLFRYLDFAVEPGNTYRYRVRVMLRNPNFNHPPELAVSPEVVEREFRWSEWSDPTSPIYVPFDAKYFLTKVNESARESQTSAVIDLFQWFPETGTFVNKTVSAKLGQPVGGTESAYVLNPIDEIFEEEKVNFSTNAVLVDVEARPDIRRQDHPDLDLGARQPTSIGVPDRAVFANEYGELVLSDPKIDEPEYSETLTRQRFQDSQFEEIKGKLQQMADDQGVMLRLDGEEQEITGSAALRRKMRELKNDRRRGGDDRDDY